MISAGNTVLLRLEKKYFDKYIKDIFEIEINDIIDFLKICPIFTKVSNETLIKLAIRTEMKKFHQGKYVLEKRYKSDYMYIIRRGSVKVINEFDN
jgi:signal-transduction protein with cAMP-binding, CBS, and nucleotidyltransferase domain